MKKTQQIANGIALILTILVNYYSNTGRLNNTTIGEVSHNLDSLFTPAGYAFSIWGLIYLLLFGFIIFQGWGLFRKQENDDFVLKIGWWFVISCLANCAWIISWLYGFTGLSVVFMFLLLISLLRIIVNNKMELWDAPIPIIAFLWWPFVIYIGWISVASIANVSAYLIKIGWNGFGFSQPFWTVFMIVIATIINLFVTWKRNMREFALVGAWALVAISFKNWDNYQIIAYSALMAALVLLISSGVHAYKNRAFSHLIN